jgi:hypothetical protein
MHKMRYSNLILVKNEESGNRPDAEGDAVILEFLLPLGMVSKARGCGCLPSRLREREGPLACPLRQPIVVSMGRQPNTARKDPGGGI